MVSSSSSVPLLPLLVFNIYINIYLNKYIIYILKTIANINYIDICN